MSRNIYEYYVVGRCGGNNYRQRSFFDFPSNNHSPYPVPPFSQQYPFPASPCPIPTSFQHPFASFSFSREISVPFQATERIIIEKSTNNDTEADSESDDDDEKSANNDTESDSESDDDDCDDREVLNDQQQTSFTDNEHNEAMQIFQRLTVDEQEMEIGILSTLLSGVRIDRFPSESNNDYRVRCFSELFGYLPPISEYRESFFYTYKHIQRQLHPWLPGYEYMEPQVKRTTFDLLPNLELPKGNFGKLCFASARTSFDLLPDLGPSISNFGYRNQKKPRFSLKFWKWFL